MGYRTYKGLKDNTKFSVFLIHGKGDDYKKVKKFIESKLQFEVRAIVDEFGNETIFKQVRDAISDCDCAVAIMSADDILADGTKYARPNVTLEIGYTIGFFDLLYWDDDKLVPVVILRDKEAYIPSDLSGVKYRQYDNTIGIESVFDDLEQTLEGIFKSIKKYYK